METPHAPPKHCLIPMDPSGVILAHAHAIREVKTFAYGDLMEDIMLLNLNQLKQLSYRLHKLTLHAAGMLGAMLHTPPFTPR